MARVKAQVEIDDATLAETRRTQAEKLPQETKDLIAAAKAALQGADTAQAVSAGHQTAVNLYTVLGSCIREAAEYALAGSDEDLVNWISTFGSLPGPGRPRDGTGSASATQPCLRQQEQEGTNPTDHADNITGDTKWLGLRPEDMADTVLGGGFPGKSKLTWSMMRKAGIDERVINEKAVDIAYATTTTVIGIFTW